MTKYRSVTVSQGGSRNIFLRSAINAPGRVGGVRRYMLEMNFFTVVHNASRRRSTCSEFFFTCWNVEKFNVWAVSKKKTATNPQELYVFPSRRPQLLPPTTELLVRNRNHVTNRTAVSTGEYNSHVRVLKNA